MTRIATKLHKTAVCLFIASTWSAGAQVIGDGSEIAQKIVANTCAACHGLDGNSVRPTVPNLAGLQTAYLVKQLRDYVAGTRRNDGATPCGPELSPKHITDLADYFSAQLPKPGTPGDPVLAAEGKQVYELGNAANDVDDCLECHKPEGRGGSGRFPKLSGQPAAYTLKQMRAFKERTRTNDKNEVMQDVAERMTEREMRSVAEYLSGF